MDYFEKLKQQVWLWLVGLVIACGFAGLLVGVCLALIGLAPAFSVAAGAVVFIASAVMATRYITTKVLEPLGVVWQAVLHVSPQEEAVPAPKPETVKFGADLLSSLLPQIYRFASQENSKELSEHRQAIIQAANIVSHLPLPLFVFNKQQQVVNASDAGLKYCHVDSAQLFGKPLYESIHMEFSSENTLEAWINACIADRINDTAYWQRVRVRLPDEKEPRQCDLAGYYNRDNPSGTEFIVTMFDRTEQYQQDDQDIGFVAMAVHELRTPLTMLRGYIEVFDDELSGTLDPELTTYMERMKVAALQLATFFNNIMNVARMEQNQLLLKLNEGNWAEILTETSKDLIQRAQVQQKSVELIVSDGLPSVAVDKVSIVEVVNNLVENALKYSPENSRVIINAHIRQDGNVETTVQDFGVGIPTGVVPNLFEKFYRSHRSSSQVAGTGLGLYLSKAIVEAHSGEIWVKSKEGEGSTFGFTLIPFTKLAEDQKNNNNDGIQRSAHGWIKNHSLYRS